MKEQVTDFIRLIPHQMLKLIDSSFEELKLLYDQIDTQDRFLWIQNELLGPYKYHSFEQIKNEKIMIIDTKMPVQSLTSNCIVVCILTNDVIYQVISNMKRAKEIQQNIQFYFFTIPYLYRFNEHLLTQNELDQCVQQFSLKQYFYSSYDPKCFVRQQRINKMANTLYDVTDYKVALQTLFETIGLPHKIISKGTVACKCLSQIEKVIKETQMDQQQLSINDSAGYKNILILSRDIDMITFFLDGQTYAEQLQLYNDKYKRYSIDMIKDSAFQSFKRVNIQSIGECAQKHVQHAKQIQMQLDEMQQKHGDIDIQELNQLVIESKKSNAIIDNMKTHIQLTKEINQARDIIFAEIYQLQQEIIKQKAKVDQIINIIYNNQLDLLQAGQLFCLHGILNGFKDKELQAVKKCFIYQYGIIGEQVYQNMLDVIQSAQSKGTTDLVKAYSIIQHDDIIDNSNIHSTYNLISPLSVKIAKYILDTKFTTTESKKVKVIQDNVEQMEFQCKTSFSGENKCLIVFIGQLTHSELAAFQLLKGFDDIEIICDDIVVGRQIVQDLLKIQD